MPKRTITQSLTGINDVVESATRELLSGFIRNDKSLSPSEKNKLLQDLENYLNFQDEFGRLLASGQKEKALKLLTPEILSSVSNIAAYREERSFDPKEYRSILKNFLADFK